MPRRKSAEPSICPNCHQPVDPTKPNAMHSAATDQWQHKDCWRVNPGSPVVAPESQAEKQPRRPSR
jgi:hypothetical protein